MNEKQRLITAASRQKDLVSDGSADAGRSIAGNKKRSSAEINRFWQRKRKQLTVGEKIAEVDKDRWTYKDLYESRHWVIGLRDVHNRDEENERFQIFYVMLDRCGMVQDYSSFFCNGGFFCIYFKNIPEGIDPYVTS